ncbi:RNA polymerase sigma-70 factor [uncultured Kriegella sp.]|uniref:RNA polymerase sigma-70 factor n=1 Tax=uncultured Kriegella sp. TaxID=1798910 RepID=UPI0030D7B935|tara:strand:- start:112926 stop:113531 length:606 start_codon:yes stop_codon:yes gene_type:complete
MGKKEYKSDEIVILELQKGHEEAFDYIFRKYYKGLCVKANGYVQDVDKAQSLVQDCFVKLWANRSTATNINNLSAYLSFMVRNRCIDYIRKAESLRILHDNIKYEQVEVEFEDFLASSIFEENLRRVIDQLPKRSRLAFEYSRFDNLTYKEIAQKMNISNKAVEALIARALRILRKDLKPYLPVFSMLCLSWTLYYASLFG